MWLGEMEKYLVYYDFVLFYPILVKCEEKNEFKRIF